jgi:AraC-like DNA-binding protein
MKIISKFAKTNEVFFKADSVNLPSSGLAIYDRLVEGDFGSAQIKAFIQNDLMLHYTFNRFVIPTEFIVSVDTDLVVNTLILHSETGIWNPDYEPYILSPNDVFTNQLFLKGEVSFSAPEKIELYRIFSTPEYYISILENYGDTFREIINKIKKREDGNIFLHSLPVSPRMKVLIMEILNYHSTNEVLTRNYIRNKTLDIIHMQLEHLVDQPNDKKNIKLSNHDISKIHEARKILKINFDHPPTLKQLASMLVTNEFKLKTGFNQLYNTSVYQYVIEVRIEKAIELMYDEKNTLEQISDNIGYANLAHFTRAFKKVKGIAPSVFRASL